MSPKPHSLLFYSKDPKAVADFYIKLGFEDVSEDKGQTRIKAEGMTLCYMDESKIEFPLGNETSKGEGFYIYFQVENVDEYYQSLKDRGLQPSTEPRDWPWGKREFVIRDPDRYKLVFYQSIA